MLEALLSKSGREDEILIDEIREDEILIDEISINLLYKILLGNKMATELNTPNNMFHDLKPYFQDTCSLGIAVFISGSLYYYKKYNDHSWMLFGLILCFFYAINDLYNGVSLDFWVHHVPQIALCIIMTFWRTSAEQILIHIYYCLIVETSSIFLSIRSLIRTYLKRNSSPLKIIKQLKPINEFVFFGLFMYTRLYLSNKYLIFNEKFYNDVLSSFNFYMLDKVVISCIIIFGFVNLYWGAILSNMFITKIVGYDITKYQPNPSDPLLMEINAVKAKITIVQPFL